MANLATINTNQPEFAAGAPTAYVQTDTHGEARRDRGRQSTQEMTGVTVTAVAGCSAGSLVFLCLLHDLCSVI